jgi:lipopolysaccharide transport system permease protein
MKSTESGQPALRPITVIEPRAQSLRALIKELIRYRSFYGFLLREISMKKFKNTLLGFWWLVIRPLLPAAMAVITFTFIVPASHYDIPYVIFFLSGFVTWNLFQATLTFMPRTLAWMRGVMKKSYFPKLLIPLASIGPPCIEFFVVGSMLILALVGYGLLDGTWYIRSDAWILMLLPCYFLALTFGMALGMFFSILALFVRDVIFSVSYFTQLMMFLTPVIYPVHLVTEPFKTILFVLNPMAVIVETSRVALTGIGTFEPIWFGFASLEIILLAVGSVWFFLRLESVLSDTL